ncbi:GAF sensor signal transduction histidine kinase [Flavobacterium limicola]|uniref:histidine kinase n=1 Tax=Flavobacterium limicola TaxID=180441 RepID=A0A495S3N5_9FLAO|nr:ATP-binding protein [Flavobacterium limicola]RKS94209.1 GAF sensor signal transduction histidine kinase [Flavobacterium limicola]
MIVPEKYIKEEERIKLLESYSILDTLPEADYDNLTLIASQICGTPIALITFLDEERQWFKSHTGLDISETPRDYSFCAYAINDPKNIFVIPDARNDIRFHDNPIVVGQPNVIFYAGVPLTNEDGLPLGTICVIDHKPKVLTPAQIRSLKALSEQTMKLLELRLNKLQLEKAMKALEQKNQELERFAYIAAHDLKSPLANISGLTDFFIDNYNESIDEDGKEVINLIKSSSSKLREMIDSLLSYTKSNATEKDNNSEIQLSILEKELSNLFVFNNNCSISFKSNVSSLYTNKTALEQILINLVTNAIKYNDKENIQIEIEIIEQNDFYKIVVGDNGPGILKEDQKAIFEIFEVGSKVDRYGVKGNGIGLATVKKIVEDLGGSIAIESEMGKGSKFKFTLARAKELVV